MEKRVTQLAVVAVLAMTLACTRDPNQGPKPKPSRLFHPMFSYWSLEKVQKKAGIDKWEVLDDRRPLSSDTRPKFHLLQIKVADYTDAGYKGDLVLWFYNDRLMKTQFYVADIKEYLKVAQEEQKFGLSSDLSGDVSPSTRIWVGKDADGRTYLGMEDRVLITEMNNWIMKYS